MSGRTVLQVTDGPTIIRQVGRTVVKESQARTVIVANQGVAGPPGPTGPQGPQGPGGGSAASYLHDQQVADDVWTIPHALGFFPAVNTFDTAGDEIEGEIAHIDNNNLTVSFNVAVSGQAYLS